MSEINETKWLRYIELCSLAISLIFWPVFFIIAGLSSWIFAFQTSYPILIILGGLLLFFIGFFWITKYLIGFMFYQPFKHYLNHEESADDRFNAYTSFLSSILIVIILLFLLTHISSFFK